MKRYGEYALEKIYDLSFLLNVPREGMSEHQPGGYECDPMPTFLLIETWWILSKKYGGYNYIRVLQGV